MLSLDAEPPTTLDVHKVKETRAVGILVEHAQGGEGSAAEAGAAAVLVSVGLFPESLMVQAMRWAGVNAHLKL